MQAGCAWLAWAPCLPAQPPQLAGEAHCAQWMQCWYPFAVLPRCQGDRCVAPRRVDDVDYEAPLALRALAGAFFAAGGVGVAWAFRAGLEDATWRYGASVGFCCRDSKGVHVPCLPASNAGVLAWVTGCPRSTGVSGRLRRCHLACLSLPCRPGDAVRGSPARAA